MTKMDVESCQFRYDDKSYHSFLKATLVGEWYEIREVLLLILMDNNNYMMLTIYKYDKECRLYYHNLKVRSEWFKNSQKCDIILI